MKAKELAEICLQHPDYDVNVGIQEYIPNEREYSYYQVPLTNDLIDIDEKYGDINLGGEFG